MRTPTRAAAKPSTSSDVQPWLYQHGSEQSLLVLCDHASNRVPAELGELGLSTADRERHIAWDSGAAGIAGALARRLDCPAFFGIWSRLVVDLNRSERAVDLIPQCSDGTLIPANQHLTQADVEARIAHYHRPYHQAIDRHLSAVEAIGVRPALISIHTFTPQLGGVQRPWHAGVLWKEPQPWVAGMVQSLARDQHVVDENVPYDGRTEMGYTLEHLGASSGRPHVMFEVRQDEVPSDAEQQAWADRLFSALHDSGFIALVQRHFQSPA